MSNNGLPRGWANCTLGDLARIIRGVSYSKDQAFSAPAAGLIPILRATNIKQYLTFDDLVYVSEPCISKDQLLQPGDIIIAASSGSKNVVGKAAYFHDNWKGSFGAFCMGLRPIPALEQKYISFFLQTHEYRHRVSELSSGSNINNLKREHIQSFPLRLAPLNEQRRIVAKIEELFSDLDAGVAALERAKENLKRYRAAVLKAAVEGKLTEAWRAEHPNTEPASKLLERILTERRQKWEKDQLAKFAAAGKEPPKNWKEKYVEPTPPEMSGLPELPEGWCWVNVDTIAFVTKLAGFEYTKYVKYDHDGELAVIKAENAGKHGFKRTDFSRVKIDTVKHLTRSRLHAGDLLMVFVGAGVGQVAKVPSDQPYFLGPNIATIQIESSHLMPDFAEHYFRSSLGFGLAMSFAKAVAQPSLSMGTIRQIPILISPSAEQEQIVAEVDRLLSVIAVADAQVEANLKRAARLRQSILKQAFAGKLVPQDPKDEPADKLLERIRRQGESGQATCNGTERGNRVKRTREPRFPVHYEEKKRREGKA